MSAVQVKGFCCLLLTFVFAISLQGCCGYFIGNNYNSTNMTLFESSPYVHISLDKTEGPAPFWVPYHYSCRDPDGDLLSCEFKLDGRRYTIGYNGNDPFKNFTAPDFYRDAINTMGTHEIELIGTDAAGHVSTYKVTFTVLKGLTLTEPGWYTCNNVSNSPCDAYQGVYCDKFVPIDINVREAAAAAIINHPGSYSVNQILDVYDWVHQHVIYQNVPVNLTYEPYSPRETLLTGSGDCKNQAVLIASMIEAIGGSARVLLIPDCHHAFAEVYIGGNETKNRFVKATFAHYGSAAPSVTWHTSKNDTEIWFPLDTAGGRYPGNTIEDCFNASQTFVIYNCNLEGWEWNAPDVEWIEYGPFKLYDQSYVIDPHTWFYFTYSINTTQYDFCTYNIKLTSKARLFGWYIIPATEYQNFREYQNGNGYSFSYYFREEQVGWADYNFTINKPDKFNVIVSNTNDYPMTVVTSINQRCYKK